MNYAGVGVTAKAGLNHAKAGESYGVEGEGTRDESLGFLLGEDDVKHNDIHVQEARAS